MFPALTELHLTGCSIESSLQDKSKSSTSTRWTNLPMIITRGNFTLDEWDHLLCLFRISHLSSTVCSESMAKRLQQDSGEGRVTAKSRLMMSVIARTLSNISSSTLESPGKRSNGNQNPWSAKAEKEERPGRIVVGSDPRSASDCDHEQSTESFFSARYSKWDEKMITMFGLLKSGKLMLRCTNDRGDPM